MYSNLDAELILISTLLQNENEIPDYLPKIIDEYFTNPEYSLVVDAIKKLFAMNKKINRVTIKEYCGEIDVDLLFDPDRNAPQDIDLYLGVLRDNYIRRELFDLSSKILPDLDSNDPRFLLEKYENKLLSLSSIENRDEIFSFREIIELSMQNIEINIRSHSMSNVVGIDLVNDSVNSQTGGARRKELTIIASRPSMGKSTYATNILTRNVIDLGKCGLFVSLEMDKDLVGRRIIAERLGIRIDKLLSKFLTKDELKALFKPIKCHDCGSTSFKTDINIEEYIVSNVCTTCGNERPQTAIDLLATYSNIKVDDRPGLSLSQIISTIKSHKIKFPELEFVIVDHLQEIGSVKGGSEKRDKFEIICKTLRNLAKELDISCILLCQISRMAESEDKDDKRPKLRHLKDAGAIEESGDLIIFLYRNSYYDNADKSNSMEFIIAKQRNGPTGTVVGVVDLSVQKVQREDFK